MYNWLLQLKDRLIEAEEKHDLGHDLVEAFHLSHHPALIEDVEAAETLFGLTFPPTLKGIYLLFNGIKDVLFPLPTLITYNQVATPFTPFSGRLELDSDNPNRYFRKKPKCYLSLCQLMWEADLYCLDTSAKGAEFPVVQYDFHLNREYELAASPFPSVKAYLLSRFWHQLDEVYQVLEEEDAANELHDDLQQIIMQETQKHGVSIFDLCDLRTFPNRSYHKMKKWRH